MSTDHPIPTASPLDYHDAPVATGADAGERSGRAVAALVIGIVALPAAIIPLAGWILGVVAIVLGATARSDARARGRAGAGQATAGLVLGVLAVLLATLVFVGVFIAST